MKTALVLIASIAALGLAACEKKVVTETETRTTTTTDRPAMPPHVMVPAPTPVPMVDPAASDVTAAGLPVESKTESTTTVKQK